MYKGFASGVVLHRLPKDLDLPHPRKGLTRCDWCRKDLQTDKVWECVGRLDHYLVCDECHQTAIVH